ncbi:unnamed protein product [Clonostachys byssicola]|uniref:Uncharacterized protein n=1 Tax=Clonostachys byssicola TaxID=160290 RepID=A0A9N9UL78_9HYPO|nr:unnamed protein product [Clonostachys byssicola]
MSNEVTTIFSEDAFQAPANFCKTSARARSVRIIITSLTFQYLLVAHARIFNGIVYASGQIPLNTSGKIVGDTIEEQTEQVLKNHLAILKAAGSSPERILRINVYLVNTEDYNGFSTTYNQMIPDPKPPRGCIFVKALPAGARVEMDLVAAT